MRGYPSLMSKFRAHRYNVLVLQQMSYAAPRHSHGIDRHGWLQWLVRGHALVGVCVHMHIL